MVPGLIIDRMNTTPRGAAIALRGLGSSGASKGFDPAVAVNIDGIYVGLTPDDCEHYLILRRSKSFVVPIYSRLTQTLQAVSISNGRDRQENWT